MTAATRLTFTRTVRLPLRLRALRLVVTLSTALDFASFPRRLKRAIETS
jgi:hypothetical protein